MGLHGIEQKDDDSSDMASNGPSGNAPHNEAPYESQSETQSHDQRDIDAARRAREEAEEAEGLALAEEAKAGLAERIAQQELADATRSLENAKALQVDADAAVEEAERILREAKERQMRMAGRVMEGSKSRGWARSTGAVREAGEE